ncbi:glycosyltransferase [Guptibacillus hwajinpoensis]|uniref:glycosyltransferase n=1 Tax=Guptibacillus hwajinpoensis TaxID=208199 RepID=UPI003D079260
MKKRILHVLNSSIYSGAENVVITMINNMRQEFDCGYVSRDGSIRKVLKDEGIEFISINKMSILEIRRVIKSFKPDIIHAHDYTASIICAVSNLRIPVISHLHNNAPWIKTYHPFSFAYLFATIRISKILGVSSAIFEEYKFGDLLKSKSIMVSNPVDISKIKSKAKLELDEKVTEYDVVLLGRLVQEKNPLRFIEIVNRLAKINPDFKAVMIGDGSLRNECELKIKQLKLEKNIVLTGFMANPYKILSQAKMLCMTSVWEGYGLVAIEALALGLPVLASPVGGLSNIVNNDSGKLCKSDEDYVSEIKKLYFDEAYRMTKSRGAILRAEDLNNINNYTQNIKCVYREVLG